MERVRIVKDLYIAQGDVRYKAGEEVEVSDAVAKRHIKSGYMKAIREPAAQPRSNNHK